MVVSDSRVADNLISPLAIQRFILCGCDIYEAE